MNTIHGVVFALQLVVLVMQVRWTRMAWRLVKRAAFAFERAANALGRCGYPMAMENLPTLRCCLAPRHTGDHAAHWTDLVTAGYVAPF